MLTSYMDRYYRYADDRYLVLSVTLRGLAVHVGAQDLVERGRGSSNNLID